MAGPRTRTLRRVLLVEAHADTRELYADYLSAVGFEVTTATAVADALLHAPAVDVVVSGLSIERFMDGLAFISQVRSADTPSRRMPVVVVTAHGSEPDRTRALAAGADMVLVKPCLPDVLAATLRHAIDATLPRPDITV